MPLSCADTASDSSRPFLFRTASSIRPAKSIAAAADASPWRLARANRSLEFSVRHALGEVRYRFTKAELTRPPRGLAALSPGHHSAPLGLIASQNATAAERRAVSVGPVDRMFATPPDSPGEFEPGLSDDRPRDPLLCYCPELSPRATRSSSS